MIFSLLQEHVSYDIIAEILIGLLGLGVTLWTQRRRIISLLSPKPKPWAHVSSHTPDHLESALELLKCGEVRLYIYHNGSNLPARLRSAGMARATVKFPHHIMDKELTPYNTGVIWPYMWQDVPYFTAFDEEDLRSELMDLAEANFATAMAATKIKDLNGRGLGVLIATWTSDRPLRSDSESALEDLDLCATRIGGSLKEATHG